MCPGLTQWLTLVGVQLLLVEGIKGKGDSCPLRARAPWPLFISTLCAHICACMCIVCMCLHACTLLPVEMWAWAWASLGLCFACGSRVCVYLRVCLSLCAWTPLCMNVLTHRCPSLMYTYSGGIHSWYTAGRVGSALLTSPYPRGPPGRARLCKAEARPGETPGEWPLGTGQAPPVCPHPTPPHPAVGQSALSKVL